MKNSQTSCWHGGRHWRSSGPISHKRRKRSFLPHPWQSPPHLSSLLFVALKDSTAYCQFCQLAAVVFTLSLLSSFLSFSTVCLQAVFVFFFLLEPGSMLCSSCCFRCDFAVVDPGEVPPLILRPNRKKIFWRPPPSPPPLSQVLDPALLCAKFIKDIVMCLYRNGDCGQQSSSIKCSRS